MLGAPLFGYHSAIKLAKNDMNCQHAALWLPDALKFHAPGQNAVHVIILCIKTNQAVFLINNNLGALCLASQNSTAPSRFTCAVSRNKQGWPLSSNDVLLIRAGLKDKCMNGKTKTYVRSVQRANSVIWGRLSAFYI